MVSMTLRGPAKHGLAVAGAQGRARPGSRPRRGAFVRRICRLACLAALLVALPASRAPEPVVNITLHPDMRHPGTTFEGWGTALAWFAVVTGDYPDATRERLADLLYGSGGLGFTIARYNIGGGNAIDTKPYLRPGGAVSGFWRQPAGATGNDWWRPEDESMWDWSADSAQRWWLDAIAHRVRRPIFEAFSNSPPWFMTVSGRVSGAGKATEENLRVGGEALFAAYLARVVDELQRRHRITIRTLSPFNEPNTDYWFAENRQEGAHWGPARQAAMIDATHAALQARKLATIVSAPDETNSNLFLLDWEGYPAATRARVGQLNVHSYGTLHQTGVRDVARASGIRLWMSENDTPADKVPEDFSDMRSALALAEHIVQDIRRLEPAAWVFWQAVEDISARNGAPGSNWGLVKMDLTAPPQAPHPIAVTAKYWAMANFSRYVRAGMRLLKVDDEDSIAAADADAGDLVLVHVNGGISPRRLEVDAQGFCLVEMIVTDATRQAKVERVEGGCRRTAVAAPRSVTTLRLQRSRTSGLSN